MMSPLLRAGTKLPSTSNPPTFSFMSRYSSTEICPVLSAFKPYCTPTLSYPERANPVSGSLPNALTMPSQKLPRAPLGLVSGLYRRSTGTTELKPLNGVCQVRAKPFQLRHVVLVPAAFTG